MKTMIAILTLALGTTFSHGQENSPNQRNSLKTTIKKEISVNYLLYLPEDYNQSKDKLFPLMIFLHGAGERGTNLDLVEVHGPPKLIKTGKKFPFIVASPQCPQGQRWDDDAILALLDNLISKYRVDTKRIYLTGLSMGGYGTWSLASKYPERFAAVAPICGGGSPIDLLLASQTKGNAIKTLGVWAFHGAKDPIVPLSESERMVNAFKRAGCQDIQLTVYPEAQHDSWTESYNNETLYDWLLKHSR